MGPSGQRGTDRVEAGGGRPARRSRNLPALVAATVFVALVGTVSVVRADDDVPMPDAERARLVQRLADTDAMLQALKLTAETNARQAEAKRAQCSERVVGFDRKLGDLLQRRKALDDRGAELFVKLAKSTEQNRNESAIVEKLRRDVEAARDSMAELEHDLVLLERWWWVPGYGQYLAIKTLVNDEAGQLRTIREELADHRLRLANHETLVQGARRMICEVIEERETTANVGNSLQCLSDIARRDSVTFRERTIALLDREAFWLELGDLGAITVDGQRRALADLLQTRPSPRTEARIAVRTAQLEAALRDYDAKLQEGRRFLQATPADFCAHEDTDRECVRPPDTSQGFEHACSDMRIEGDGSVLSAVCAGGRGAPVRSSTGLHGIHNDGGTLVQGGVPGTPGFSKQASSFQRTCRDIFVCGGTLMASCADRRGAWAPTSLKLRGIVARDGRLAIQGD